MPHFVGRRACLRWETGQHIGAVASRIDARSMAQAGGTVAMHGARLVQTATTCATPMIPIDPRSLMPTGRVERTHRTDRAKLAVVSTWVQEGLSPRESADSRTGAEFRMWADFFSDRLSVALVTRR